MKLWAEVSLSSVLVRLVHGTRLLTGDGVEVTANKSAISEALRIGQRAAGEAVQASVSAPRQSVNSGRLWLRLTVSGAGRE